MSPPRERERNPSGGTNLAGFTSTPVQATCIADLMMAVGVQASPLADATTGPSHLVSEVGQALHEYEALVHQLLGSYPSVCTSTGERCRTGSFHKSPTGPEARYEDFTSAFTGFGRSSFHVMPPAVKLAPGAFGNFPTPAMVHGSMVACDPAPRSSSCRTAMQPMPATSPAWPQGPTPERSRPRLSGAGIAQSPHTRRVGERVVSVSRRVGRVAGG